MPGVSPCWCAKPAAQYKNYRGYPFFGQFCNMKNRWLLHAGFWLAYWFVFTFSNGNYEKEWGKFAITEGVMMPPRMIATYLSFWCFDKLRPSWKAFAGILAAILLGGLMVRFIKMVYIGPVWFPDYNFRFFSHRFITDTLDSVVAAGSALTARLYFRQQEFIRRETALRAEKSEAELQALKNQLNPHFLFNTINNLYALARVKSDRTAPVAMQLANLLRYLLYDSSVPTVRIEQEVTHLKQYVELERLRFDEERLSVKFETDIDDVKQPVTPLLMLPLVENAFKHGAGESMDEAWVHISIRLQRKQLEMKVENSRGSVANGTQKGIGLQNIRRQLELLYPNSGSLTTHETDNTYSATLKITYP
jgi:two-component system, LytTR family, sensor kinase